jgi:hypothetical protein
VRTRRFPARRVERIVPFLTGQTTEIEALIGAVWEIEKAKQVRRACQDR